MKVASKGTRNLRVDSSGIGSSAIARSSVAPSFKVHCCEASSHIPKAKCKAPADVGGETEADR